MKTTSPGRSLFLLLFFIFSAAILGDTTSEALLLAHYPAEIMPKMFLVNALCLFLISIFLITVIDRLDRGRFFIMLLVVHILFICGIRFLTGFSFVYPLLFSYSYTTKILLFMLFWTVANDICDAREAKTLFPRVAAGGILGGLFISFLISFIVQYLAPKNLILLWAVMNVLSLFLFLPVNRNFRKDLREKPVTKKEKISLKRDFLMIREEPLLKVMTVLYFLIFFLLLNQDYQFYQVLRGAFASYGNDMAQKLSSFLGLFRGISTTVTFMIQLTVAGVFIRKFGTAKSMYLLPGVFFFVFGILTIQAVTGYPPDGFWGEKGTLLYHSLFPLILTGIAIRIAVFDSIFSPNFQIFFSSLPKEIRGRGKIFVEGVVKPLAIGIAGLCMIFILKQLSSKVIFLSLTVLSFILLVLTSRLKTVYTDSIARYLGGLKSERLSSILNMRAEEAGESLLAVLSKTLSGDDWDLKAFSVEILARFKTNESISILKEYMGKGPPQLKSMIVSSLGDLKDDQFSGLFKDCLADPNDRVKANAIYALARLESEENQEIIKPFIFYPNNRVKANAILATWRNADEKVKLKSIRVLEEMLQSESHRDISSALFTYGEIGEKKYIAHFESLKPVLDEKQDMVREQWARALSKMRYEESLEILIDRLEKTTGREEGGIKSAVSRLAPYFTERLCGYLDHHSWRINKCVLSVILDMNAAERKPLRKRVLQYGMELAADTHRLQEINNRLFVKSKDPHMQFFSTVIHEEWIEEAKDCLAFSSAIMDPTGKIKMIRGKLRHADAHIRANAIEALENLGETSLNRLIIPLFEKGKTKLPDLPAGKRWPDTGLDKADFLKKLLTMPLPWVHICCIFSVYKSYLSSKDDALLDTIQIGAGEETGQAVREKMNQIMAEIHG